MNRSSHRVTAVVLGSILALGTPALVSCGSAVENAVEEAAGNALGGDVSIDDGNMTVTDAEGNEMQIGENIAVPDNWPAEIPVYEDGALISVVIGSGGASINAIWTTTGTPEEAAAAYGSALESAGFSGGDTSAVAGMSSMDYTGNGYTINVTTIAADGSTTLMMNAEKG